MSAIPDDFEALRERYREIIPARGHVSYLCATRVVPRALVASGWPPGISWERVSGTHPTWVISGRDYTSTEGQAIIDVNEYVEVPECDPIEYQDHWGPAIIDGRPPFFVMPNSEEPVLVSTKIEATVHEKGNWRYRDLIDGHFYPPSEVEYKITATVRTWNAKSDPVPVDFSWLCIAEGAMRWMGA